jgi:hypothetical protein
VIGKKPRHQILQKLMALVRAINPHNDTDGGTEVKNPVLSFFLILTDSVVYNKIPRAVDRKRTLLPSDWLEKWCKTG